MTDLTPKLLVTSTNINGMGSSVKRKRVSKWLTTQTQWYDTHKRQGYQ